MWNNNCGTRFTVHILCIIKLRFFYIVPSCGISECSNSFLLESDVINLEDSFSKLILIDNNIKSNCQSTYHQNIYRNIQSTITVSTSRIIYKECECILKFLLEMSLLIIECSLTDDNHCIL